MAQAGFFSKPLPGSQDNAACFACGKNLDGWSETDSPYNEHARHSKECELVRLDLTPSRVASFVHGYWPHSQSLLPHTVSGKSRVIVVLRWHRLGSTIIQGMSRMTRRCASNADLPWMDGKWTILQGTSGSVKLFDCHAISRHEHEKRKPRCPFLLTGQVHRPASFEFLMSSRSDDKAVKELPEIKEPSTLSLNEKQRIRTSHHAGKRSTITTGKRELYVEIQSGSSQRSQQVERHKDFKLPKLQRKELPTIAAEELPNELTRWIEPGDLDRSMGEFLDSVSERQKAAFARLVQESLHPLLSTN